MNRLNFAAILAAGAALALSPAQVGAQETAKPVSMGTQVRAHGEGIELIAVLPGHTAAALGFRVGDILIEAGGRPVSPEWAEKYLEQVKAGDRLSFKVKRAGALIELAGTALAAPEGAPAPTAQPSG